MKLFMIISILITLLAAEKMFPSQHQSLHTYNYRPTLKKQAEKNAHKLHKIDEKKAREIAREHCGEDAIKLKLAHTELYLYYIATTKGCRLYIDALSGAILDPKTINKEKKK